MKMVIIFVLQQKREIMTHNWRNDKITEKQMNYIIEMNEFSDFPLPVFSGTTKGEASDYINKYQQLAHERFDSNEDMYGNWD